MCEKHTIYNKNGSVLLRLPSIWWLFDKDYFRWLFGSDWPPWCTSLPYCRRETKILELRFNGRISHIH